jgi:hypothetical protein
MLEPDGRSLLLDALRPPLGHQLDAAVGTTYSLDLVSLLTAPVAFAMFDRQRADGSAVADPVAMLQALREHSERITLFHGAGQVTVPPIDQRLIVYLEQAVYAVVPPNPKAIFHPKVWYLRYRDRETDAVSLRFLCLSRNLTPDRSWDTLLRLDGVPGSEVRHPELAEFADALVDLANRVRTVPDARAATVRSLGADFARATWTLPDGFSSIRFRPLGYDTEDRLPFDGRIDRMLVISPFLTGGAIAALTRKRRRSILVSCPEEIDRVGRKALAHLAERLVLASDANAAPADIDTAEPPTQGQAPGDRLIGLHAKVYVADAGWQGRLWTGSANATDAAFHGNVEFLVELGGRKRDCGVDAVIGDRTGRIGLRNIVEPYDSSREDERPKTQEEILTERLDVLRRAIGGLRYEAVCHRATDGRWTLRLQGEPVNGTLDHLDLTGVELQVWPATVGAGAGRTPELSGGLSASFDLSEEGVTPYFGVSLAAGPLSVRFAVIAELTGAPEGRAERVLASILSDQPSLIRFLLLLLGNLDEALDASEHGAGAAGHGEWLAAFETGALLEPLVRAYARDPDRLRDVERVLGEIARSGHGDGLLPADWDAIWTPIAAALSDAGVR